MSVNLCLIMSFRVSIVMSMSFSLSSIMSMSLNLSLIVRIRFGLSLIMSIITSMDFSFSFIPSFRVSLSIVMSFRFSFSLQFAKIIESMRSVYCSTAFQELEFLHPKFNDKEYQDIAIIYLSIVHISNVPRTIHFENTKSLLNINI